MLQNFSIEGFNPLESIVSLVPGSILSLFPRGDLWEQVYTDFSNRRNHFEHLVGESPVVIKDGLNNRPILSFNGETAVSLSEELIDKGGSYTIFSLARYSGGKRGRIFSSTNNWLFGFHEGDQDALFMGSWIARGIETSEEWILHSLSVDYDQQRVIFRSSGKEVANFSFEESAQLTTMGLLTIGGWGNKGKQYSECEVAFIQVYDRPLEPMEVLLIERALGDYYSISKGGFDFIKMCLDNSKLISEFPKMARYCFDICMGEMRNLELAKYFLDNTNPSTPEYHKMSSSYWEGEGDMKKSLKHSFQAFFLEPENIATISRLMDIKRRANFGSDIFDCLLINLYITQKGGKPIIPKHEDSSLSFNSNKFTSDLISFSEQNWMDLDSGNFSHFFDKIDDYLASNYEGVNDLISENLQIRESDQSIREEIIRLLKVNEDSEKVLRYSTEYFKHNKRKSVGGFADRIKGITTVMLLSIVTERRFEIDWREPFPIEEIFHINDYDWKVRDKTTEPQRICLIDGHFSENLRESLKRQDAQGIIGINQDICEINCNIYSHSCFENPSSAHYLANLTNEALEQPKMIGSLFSLFDYKPNLIESAIIYNFDKFSKMYDDSIGIQFRTGGDGDWMDPEVDSMENATKLIDRAIEIESSSGVRSCIFFASDSNILKSKMIGEFCGQLDIFYINIPIAHIDRSEGDFLISGSRFAIMENYLLSICGQVLTGKGAYAVISANRSFNWPWRYHKSH